MSRAEHDEDDLSPLPPEQEAALLTALSAAWRPSELSPSLNERLIEMALEDPLAPPSEAELVESERLRGALDDGTPHEDAALLHGLRAGVGEGFEEDLRDAALERALERALPSDARKAEPKRRSNVIYAVFGAGSLVAAAAAALLLVTTRAQAPQASLAEAPSEYARPRSTATLFSERFDTQDTTARMDAIASARSRDLRDNRYAAWGVR